MKNAYDQEDAPEAKDIPALAALVAAHASVRDTSSLLSWNQKKQSRKQILEGDKLNGMLQAFLYKNVGQQAFAMMNSSGETNRSEAIGSNPLLELKPGQASKIAEVVPPASLLQGGACCKATSRVLH